MCGRPSGAMSFCSFFGGEIFQNHFEPGTIFNFWEDSRPGRRRPPGGGGAPGTRDECGRAGRSACGAKAIWRREESEGPGE